MARSVVVNILGDSRDFSRAVNSARGDADRLDGTFSRVSGGFSRFARTAALGIGALGLAGGAAALSFLRAAEEAQQVARQTDAVLESMGASAWTSASQVETLATELSNLTGIDDELIQSGQNVLLTFGQVQNRIGEGNDVFDRATRAALDMSVALGTDMNAAAMQVGKALNDPIRGLATLRRAGIQFTAQQEDQIRAMVEAGDVAGAQRVMLEELERQFGGSAEAQATASQRLSTIWENLQEQLGEYLIPLAEDFADWMGENLPTAIERAKDVVGDLVDKGKDLSEWMREHKGIVIAAAAVIGGVLVAAFIAWAASAASAAVATIAATWPVLLIGAAIAALVAALIYAYQNWEGFRNVVDTVGRFLRDTAWPNIQRGAMVIRDGLVNAINVAKRAWELFGPAIEAGARVAIHAVAPIVTAVQRIVAIIQSAIDKWNQLQALLGRGQSFDKQLGAGSPRMGGSGAQLGLKSFHTGGIYVAPGGAREGPAWLETGEQVVPRGQVAASGGQPVQVQVFLDGKAVVDSLVRYERTNGPIQVRVA